VNRLLSERMRIELPMMENRLANGLVIFLIVPYIKEKDG